MQTTRIVTGDSYRAQHSNTKHFGLGHAATVDSIEIVWLDGKRKIFQQPRINQYHEVSYPTD